MSRETLADFIGVLALSAMAVFLFSLPSIMPSALA